MLRLTLLAHIVLALCYSNLTVSFCLGDTVDDTNPALPIIRNLP